MTINVRIFYTIYTPIVYNLRLDILATKFFYSLSRCHLYQFTEHFEERQNNSENKRTRGTCPRSYTVHHIKLQLKQRKLPRQMKQRKQPTATETSRSNWNNQIFPRSGFHCRNVCRLLSACQEQTRLARKVIVQHGRIAQRVVQHAILGRVRIDGRWEKVSTVLEVFGGNFCSVLCFVFPKKV